MVKTWIEDEIDKTKKEEKYYMSHPKEKTKRDKDIFKRFILLIIVFALFFSITSFISINNNKNIVQWVCACGYDNYDQIRYCGICGDER